jgi:hypothetical protein
MLAWLLEGLVLAESSLTLTLFASSVNTRTNYHYIVYNGEAAFTADPLAISVLDTTIRQHSSFVRGHSFLVERAHVGEFIRREEVPCWFVDHFIRRVAEDVDYGVGSVEDACIVFETCIGTLALGVDARTNDVHTVNRNECSVHLGHLRLASRRVPGSIPRSACVDLVRLITRTGHQSASWPSKPLQDAATAPIIRRMLLHPDNYFVVSER